MQQAATASSSAAVPPKPEPPVHKRLVVSDATTEALVPILKDNPRGVVRVGDELTGWVQSMNQYRAGGRGADVQFWLSAWSGVTVTKDRSGTHEQGPLRVRRPFISVIGGLTPDKLTTLRGDKPWQRSEQDGFIDRVLLSYPQEVPATGENWLEVAPETLQQLRDVMNKLLDLQMIPVVPQGGDEAHDWRPKVVRLTTSGRQAWERFTRSHAAEINRDGFPPSLVGPWAKLRGYCARLALIIHFLRHAAGEVNDEDGDGESMARAARLVRYFKEHARKVYAVMDADPKVATARRLLRWIVRNGQPAFTRRDAYRAMRGAVKNVEEVDPLLDLLERHAYIRPAPAAESHRAGRKASPGFEVNPSILGQNGHIGQNPTVGGTASGAEASSVQSVHSVPGGGVLLENVADMEGEGSHDKGCMDDEQTGQADLIETPFDDMLGRA
jgi:hypothetical protein